MSAADALLLEVEEQARLLGMGSEREARLMAERDRLRTLLERSKHMVEDCQEDYLRVPLDDVDALLADIEEALK